MAFTPSRKVPMLVSTPRPGSASLEHDPLSRCMIRKAFGADWFFGQVMAIDVDPRTGERAYHVVYEDGDEEHLREGEVRRWMVERHGTAPSRQAPGVSPSRGAPALPPSLVRRNPEPAPLAAPLDLQEPARPNTVSIHLPTLVLVLLTALGVPLLCARVPFSSSAVEVDPLADMGAWRSTVNHAHSKWRDVAEDGRDGVTAPSTLEARTLSSRQAQQAPQQTTDQKKSEATPAQGAPRPRARTAQVGKAMSALVSALLAEVEALDLPALSLDVLANIAGGMMVVLGLAMFCRSQRQAFSSTDSSESLDASDQELSASPRCDMQELGFYVATIAGEDRVVRLTCRSPLLVDVYETRRSHKRVTFRKGASGDLREVAASDLRDGPFQLTAGKAPPHIALMFECSITISPAQEIQDENSALVANLGPSNSFEKNEKAGSKRAASGDPAAKKRRVEDRVLTPGPAKNGGIHNRLLLSDGRFRHMKSLRRLEELGFADTPELRWTLSQNQGHVGATLREIGVA